MSTISARQKSQIQQIIDNGGPDPHQYAMLDQYATEIKSKDQIDAFRHSIAPILTIESLMGHTYLKPYGYAGDLEIIEKMYQDDISDDPRIQKWDKYYM